jgi:hypothetical protein
MNDACIGGLYYTSKCVTRRASTSVSIIESCLLSVTEVSSFSTLAIINLHAWPRRKKRVLRGANISDYNSSSSGYVTEFNSVKSVAHD